MQNRNLILTGILVFTLSLIGVYVLAQTPNPGHLADEIGEGTFAGPGDYSFPANVGIGTESPEQNLHVNGQEVLSTGATAGFKFRDRGGVNTNNWVWYSSGNVARFWRQGAGDLIRLITVGFLIR